MWPKFSHMILNSKCLKEINYRKRKSGKESKLIIHLEILFLKRLERIKLIIQEQFNKHSSFVIRDVRYSEILSAYFLNLQSSI